MRPFIRAYFPYIYFSLFPGVVIALFFQCTSALLNPLDRTRRSIKWGLVAHTVAMFSFATIYVGMGFHIQSICYIDDRDYDQDGPVAYEIVLYRTAVALVANTLVLVNVWLADALLVSPVLNLATRLFDLDPFL
jgi:hypothetical protein